MKLSILCPTRFSSVDVDIALDIGIYYFLRRLRGIDVAVLALDAFDALDAFAALDALDALAITATLSVCSTVVSLFDFPLPPITYPLIDWVNYCLRPLPQYREANTLWMSNEC